MRRFPSSTIETFIRAVFVAAGSEPHEARIVASHLVEASLMGHDSHGVIRVSKYVDWLKAGQVRPNRHARIVSDRGALVVVDGDFGFGQVIGKEAMEIAAERGASHGVATVAIRNAGHLGRVGAWPQMLAERGLASIHFVNTSGFGILVAPFGGADRRLSANPIAAGVPIKGGRPIILDIATSAIAEGKIQVARNKGEELPPGLVLDGHGRPTTDPEVFYAKPPGAILPFGGHKGSGLSFFCEILAGSLTGGHASNPRSPTAERLVNNMLSLAFDPGAFGDADAFVDDVIRLVTWVKASPPISPNGKVLLPGEMEENVRCERVANGLPIDDATWRALSATAASLGVSAPMG
ncbi:MAG: malate/lactate/ureidoglycolate dehydrogenase [Hyphomicrobiales bacterium]|nr:malate/lactate/ureidoglycolate dehydrogenase [Hyphomicrobiales bacterium]